MAMRYPRGTHLNWSPITRDEIPDISTLLTAIEHLDEPAQTHTLEGLYANWEAPGFEPRDTLLGRDSGGTLVAYGHNQVHADDTDPRRVYLMGGVHPGWRRQGVGRALLAWQLTHARQWYASTWQPTHGPLHIFGWAEQRLADRASLFSFGGLTPMRWFADLSLNLSEVTPAAKPAAVPGIDLVPYHPELSEAVRAAHNEAFADRWGTQPVPRDAWEDQLAREPARPGWSWLAVRAGTNEVVGYALNSINAEGEGPAGWHHHDYAEGWTDRLGVRHGWRGRGIARALLAVSVATFAREGLDAAGIGVDSDKPAGAFALYAGLGYTPGDVEVMYGRVESHAKALGALALAE